MDVSFGLIIKESFDWMVRVLFKTFNLKKWIALTFIAIMAGYLSFNLNMNMGGNDRGNNALRSCPSGAVILSSLGVVEAGEGREIEPPLLEQEPVESQTTISSCPNFLNDSSDYIILWIVGACVLIIMVLFTWLSSRFRFIFIEDIIKNEGSIKLPWSNNVLLGNSLFKFYLIYTLIYLGILGAFIFRGYVSLKALGVFSENANVPFLKILGSILPLAGFCILFILLAAVIYFFVENMVMPIMYKKKQAFISSWREAGALLQKNTGNFIAFVFINFGLGIAAAIATGLILLFYLVIVIIAGGLIVLLAAGILGLLPLGLKLVVGFVFGLIAVIGLLCIYFVANMLLLPIAVFFRTLGLKFIAALDKSYNLFALKGN
jgi:hypothetical protein